MKRTKLGAVAVAIALVVQLLGMTGAFSQKVGNPSGPFTYTIHNANLRINDEGFSFDDTHTPQCSDGQNNDTDFLGGSSQQDGNIDFVGGDPQCTSAADDSEVVGGFQPVEPVRITGNINGSGQWTVSPVNTTNVYFPPAYAFAENPANGSTFVVTITITGRTGAAGAWTGNLDPHTGAANLTMQLRVSITGGPISSTCHIGDDTGGDTLVAQTSTANPGGVPYDPDTGTLTMAQQNFRVPPAKDCGTIIIVSIADQINSSFGIPTNDSEAVFTGDFAPGNRPQRSINPNLTVTPGVACRATSFSAAGTTSQQLATNFQFDRTNDGTFDTSGPVTTTSEVFATAGTRTARLKVTDVQGDSEDVIKTYTVGPNLPPTAPSQNLPRSAAGAPVNFTLGGADPEGGSVTRTIIVSPVNGTISGSSPNFTYTPTPGFGGADVLTYRVSDDCADSADTTGTVTFNVNRLPVPNGQTIPTTQEIPVNFTLTGSDADGDALTFTVVDTPDNGSLVGTEPNLQYVPNPGFNGLDSLTFKANDGLNDSAGVGTITFNVVKNERPVANSQALTTPEDTGLDITLTATDGDGDPLTYTVLTGPTNGTLTPNPALPDLRYEPNGNFNGGDSFTFRADDGKGGISDATVTITVSPVNDPPVANDQSFILQQDTSRAFTLAATDVDSSLSFTPTTPVANGVLTGSFPNFTYTPNPGFIGVDTLVYDVSDGPNADSATVTFNVVATNQPPVAGSAVVNTNEDVDKAITLNASDPEGGPIEILILDAPDHGALIGTAPNLTYDPDPNYFGPDSFQFSVEDDVEQLSIGTISINVLAVNDAPGAQDQTVSVFEDVPKSIILGAIDPDDVNVSYQVTSIPAHGTVTGTAPNLTYTPVPNYHGADSFTFRARDPKGAQTTGTITLDVTSVNDSPTANVISKTVAEDGTVATTFTGSDVDGDALTFHVVIPPQHGVLLGSAPSYTYKPDANYNGFETFSYRANDGQVDSFAASVTIAITAVNDAPVAQAQSVNVMEDTPTAITVVGTDVDGDALVYKVEQAPTKGKLTGTVPNLTYTPNADYNGADSFKFSVTDPKGLKGTATVSITVQAAPLIPTKLVAETVIAKLNPLLLTWTYPKLKATLTRADNNQPLAGRTVEFWVYDKKVCQAVTNTAGQATCNGSANTFRQTYLAKFNGDADFAATQAEGVVLK